MGSLLRLLMCLSLTWTAGVFCSPIAFAQTRAQQERRLTELEERFERLLQLEEWQDNRRSELEMLVREARVGFKSLNSVNQELRRQVVANEVLLNQLRRDQLSLHHRIHAAETARRPVAQAPQQAEPTPSDKVYPLRIVPPTVSPPESMPVSTRARSAPVSLRQPDGYAWPRQMWQ